MDSDEADSSIGAANEGASKRARTEASPSSETDAAAKVDVSAGSCEEVASSGASDAPPECHTSDTVGRSRSPARFVSVGELSRLAACVTDMSLAHHIATDDNFQLHVKQTPSNSLEGQIKKVVHQAFWDRFQQSLASSPANYTSAADMILDMKRSLLSMLLPWQTRIKTEIEEKMDEQMIRQQAEAGTLELSEYMSYVIELMRRFCAPHRDAAVAALVTSAQQSSHSPASLTCLARAIMETLPLLAVDMANVHMQLVKPVLAQHGARYERDKMAAYLQASGDKLPCTRAWLAAAARAGDSDGGRCVFHAACVSLMTRQSSEGTLAPPETLLLDWTRLQALRSDCVRLVLLSASLLLLYSATCQDDDTAGVLREQSVRTRLEEQLTALLHDLDVTAAAPSTASVTTTTDEQTATDTMTQRMRAVAAHCVQFVKTESRQQQPEERLTATAARIEQLARADNELFCLLQRRLLQFLRQVLDSGDGGTGGVESVQLPAGMSACADRIKQCAGQLLRLTRHNWLVHEHVYERILAEPTPAPSNNQHI